MTLVSCVVMSEATWSTTASTEHCLSINEQGSHSSATCAAHPTVVQLESVSGHNSVPLTKPVNSSGHIIDFYHQICMIIQSEFVLLDGLSVPGERQGLERGSVGMRLRKAWHHRGSKTEFKLLFEIGICWSSLWQKTASEVRLIAQECVLDLIILMIKHNPIIYVWYPHHRRKNAVLRRRSLSNISNQNSAIKSQI